MRSALMSVEELQRRLSDAFPETFHPTSGIAIQDAWYCGCRVRLGFQESTLRPGGTISGPTLMMLSDVAMYVAILASIGWQPLAVTTNLNINFLKKPPAAPLVADCRLIKLGKRLAVGEVALRSEGEDDLVAHATSTYSIPPGNR